MPKRNINLDIVRILAAFMVLSVHIGQHIGKDFGVGAKGVQLFFVLSGYLAFVSIENKSALKYYKSRLIRILPTYYFCLILIYLEDIVIAIYEGTLREVFKGQCGIGFFRYVFFIHCFTPSNNWNMWNNHSALWAMSSFIGFYLLAPWLYKLIKNTFVGIAVLFMLLLSRNWMINVIQQVLGSYPDEAHIEWFSSMNPLTELYCFLFGAVLFIAIRESKQYLYLLILLIGMIISSLSWYSYEIVFVILVAVSVLCENMTSNIAISKIINWLSKGSFTLYLVHPLVLAVESGLWYKLGIWRESLHGLVLYISCIAASYFIYYCIINKIERRIIK